MSDVGQCLMLLVALDDETSWSTESLQTAIKSVQDLVNSASDITGIVTTGLIADYWGDVPVITYWVQHDSRYGDSFESVDDMIVNTFYKAIELAGYINDLWVLDSEERASLETG